MFVNEKLNKLIGNPADILIYNAIVPLASKGRTFYGGYKYVFEKLNIPISESTYYRALNRLVDKGLLFITPKGISTTKKEIVDKYPINEINQPGEIKTSEEVIEFQENFWKKYPKKRNKHKTNQWISENIKEILPVANQIFEAIEKFKKTNEWKLENGRYITSPIKFLSEKIYLDTPNESRSEEWMDEYMREIKGL